MELNEQRRDLWEIVRKYENQPFIQISAHKEIHALTKSILQLYETLPLLVTVVITQIGHIFDYLHGLHFAACSCTYGRCN